MSPPRNICARPLLKPITARPDLRFKRDIAEQAAAPSRHQRHGCIVIGRHRLDIGGRSDELRGDSFSLAHDLEREFQDLGGRLRAVAKIVARLSGCGTDLWSISRLSLTTAMIGSPIRDFGVASGKSAQFGQGLG